jgi:hypothetical protein
MTKAILESPLHPRKQLKCFGDVSKVRRLCVAEFEKEGDELPHSRHEVAPTMAEQFIDHCELAHPVATDGNGRLFLAPTKISSME